MDSGKARAPSALLHLFSLTRLRLRIRLNLESHFPIFVHAFVRGTPADTGLLAGGLWAMVASWSLTANSRIQSYSPLSAAQQDESSRSISVAVCGLRDPLSWPCDHSKVAWRCHPPPPALSASVLLADCGCQGGT